MKKLLCLLTMVVIAVSAFTGNAFAYYDGTYESYNNPLKVKVGSITFLLKDYTQCGSVKIPYSATVVEIPDIKKVEIPEKITYDGIEFTVTDWDLYNFSSQSLKEKEYKKVEEIVLPETIYNIYEFSNFPKLKKMNLPKNTLIGRNYSNAYGSFLVYTNEDFNEAGRVCYFDLCPNLKLSVDPNHPYYSYKNDMLLSKDGKKVYMSFNHSTDITIPDGVEKLVSWGGYGFYHVKNVKLPNSLKYLGGDWSSLTKITLPKGLEEIGYHAFSSSKLTKIIIPDSVKKIGDGAFLGSTLKSVKFGKNLTEIENGAFKNCKNLKSVTIPKKVKNIGISAFRDCKKLKNVKILSSNVEISHLAFDNCTNLKSVTINDAKEIGSKSFNNCKRLSKIIINNKRKAPKISSTGGFKNTKNGLKFVVKNKKVAKQFNKQLKKFKRKLRNAKIMVGKKVIYKNING